mgnify:FL=1
MNYVQLPHIKFRQTPVMFGCRFSRQKHQFKMKGVYICNINFWFIHGYCVLWAIMKSDAAITLSTEKFIEQIKADTIGLAFTKLLEAMNVSRADYRDAYGFGEGTVDHIVNRYDFDMKPVTIIRAVLVLNVDYRLSKFLLNKAGICEGNCPASKIYWSVLKKVNSDFIPYYSKNINFFEEVPNTINEINQRIDEMIDKMPISDKKKVEYKKKYRIKDALAV